MSFTAASPLDCCWSSTFFATAICTCEIVAVCWKFEIDAVRSIFFPLPAQLAEDLPPQLLTRMDMLRMPPTTSYRREPVAHFDPKCCVRESPGKELFFPA